MAFGVQYTDNKGKRKTKDFPTDAARQKWVDANDDLEILAYSDEGEGMLSRRAGLDWVKEPGTEYDRRSWRAEYEGKAGEVTAWSGGQFLWQVFDPLMAETDDVEAEGEEASEELAKLAVESYLLGSWSIGPNRWLSKRATLEWHSEAPSDPSSQAAPTAMTSHGDLMGEVTAWTGGKWLWQVFDPAVVQNDGDVLAEGEETSEELAKMAVESYLTGSSSIGPDQWLSRKAALIPACPQCASTDVAVDKPVSLQGDDEWVSTASCFACGWAGDADALYGDLVMAGRQAGGYYDTGGWYLVGLNEDEEEGVLDGPTKNKEDLASSWKMLHAQGVDCGARYYDRMPGSVPPDVQPLIDRLTSRTAAQGPLPGPYDPNDDPAYQKYIEDSEREQAEIDRTPAHRGHKALGWGICDICGGRRMLYSTIATTIGYPGHPGAEETEFATCATCLDKQANRGSSKKRVAGYPDPLVVQNPGYTLQWPQAYSFEVGDRVEYAIEDEEDNFARHGSGEVVRVEQDGARGVVRDEETGEEWDLVPDEIVGTFDKKARIAVDRPLTRDAIRQWLLENYLTPGAEGLADCALDQAEKTGDLRALDARIERYIGQSWNPGDPAEQLDAVGFALSGLIEGHEREPGPHRPGCWYGPGGEWETVTSFRSRDLGDHLSGSVKKLPGGEVIWQLHDRLSGSTAHGRSWSRTDVQQLFSGVRRKVAKLAAGEIIDLNQIADDLGWPTDVPSAST